MSSCSLVALIIVTELSFVERGALSSTDCGQNNIWKEWIVGR